MRHSKAWTLLELLIVIAILGILVGIVLSAVQKAREAALRTKSQNNLKQLVMGFHHYAATHENQLPGMKDWDGPCRTLDDEDALFKVLFRSKCIETPFEFSQLNAYKPETFFIPLLVDPADPSWRQNPTPIREDIGNSSYAINTWAFKGPSRALPAGFRDGTSNTIGIGSHYMRCRRRDGDSEMAAEYQWNVSGGTRGTTVRRTTFADPFYGDVLPVVSPGYGTKPTKGFKTFQSAPRVDECDPTIQQSPYRAGLLVAMMDGSVRTIKYSGDARVFWAAVTPAGGETEQLD